MWLSQLQSVERLKRSREMAWSLGLQPEAPPGVWRLRRAVYCRFSIAAVKALAYLDEASSLASPCHTLPEGLACTAKWTAGAWDRRVFPACPSQRFGPLKLVLRAVSCVWYSAKYQGSFSLQVSPCSKPDQTTCYMLRP
ncbi:hypothetical protein ABPG77_010525 [Micractinium sp. CCAP 211/92]